MILKCCIVCFCIQNNVNLSYADIHTENHRFHCGNMF